MIERRKSARYGWIAVCGTVLAMAATAGCSGQQPAAPSAAADKAVMNFDLGKCEPIETGLYKCPAIDKPICDPGFARNDVVCVKVNKSGSVLVESMGD
jgi:hypothetical protein